MNTETKNRPVRKAAGVVGFIALLLVIAWLSIMIVRNVPGSFASLASLAESVRTFDLAQTERASDDEATQINRLGTMLIVTSDTNVTNVGEDVRLSWTDASVSGSFIFSYECADGVAIDLISSEGSRSVDCDTNYNLGDVTNATIQASSEKERFVDVSYQVAFLASNDTTPRATDQATLTIVNDSVPLVNAESEETVVTETTPTETVTAEVTEPVEPTSTPVNPETTTGGTEFTQEFTYTIPLSDPNGRVDLGIRYIGIGSISNNSFVAGTVDNDENGAVQFEVKNYGSKTSEAWTYEINLPSGGMIESDDQVALKPNERAIITIGFPPSTVTSHQFVVSVDTVGDATLINDRFVKTVNFSN